MDTFKSQANDALNSLDQKIMQGKEENQKNVITMTGELEKKIVTLNESLDSRVTNNVKKEMSEFAGPVQDEGYHSQI